MRQALIALLALAATSFGQTGRITGAVTADSDNCHQHIRHGATRSNRAGDGEEVRCGGEAECSEDCGEYR
jgi:hypothetical protein